MQFIPIRSRARAALFAAAAVLATTGGVALGPAPAGATSAGGTITGLVTDRNGLPQPGICVAASSASSYASVKTGAAGTYALSVPAGTYVVEFFPGCGGPNDAIQWYRAQPAYASATPVAVTVGEVTGGVDATLAPGGKITGSVVDLSGEPIKGVCAYAYLNLPMGQSTLYNDVASGADGTFTFLGMQTGSYMIEFVPACYGPSRYAIDWYPGSPSEGGATEVAVTAPASTGGIDVRLSTGGSITGQVTDASGNPLPGICINPIEATASGEVVTFVETESSATGDFLVTGLPPGEAILDFFPGCGGGDYVPTFYGGATQQTAQPIPVTAGKTTSGIDVRLSPGGAIDGTVTDLAGNPLAGICVEADATSGPGYGTTPSAGDGTYDIQGLPAGTYKVLFRSGCGGGYYRPQWYSDAGVASAATPVAVQVGGVTGAIDVRLEPMAGVVCSPAPSGWPPSIAGGGGPGAGSAPLSAWATGIGPRTHLLRPWEAPRGARAGGAAVGMIDHHARAISPRATWCNGYPALGGPGSAGSGASPRGAGAPSRMPAPSWVRAVPFRRWLAW